MRNLLALMTCLILALNTGCTTAIKTRKTIPITTGARARINVYYNIDTMNQQTGTASSSYLFGFIKISGPNVFAEDSIGNAAKSKLGNRINILRAAAIHEALKNSNADRLVDPQYEIKIVTYPLGIFKKYIVAVKGHEAVINDISPLYCDRWGLEIRRY